MMSARHRIYADFVKPACDRAAALLLLLLLAPILLTVAVAVRLALGSPVLFAQVRPGKAGRPFRMLKFRTMTEARAHTGELLPDDERLPRFGRWLRSTSLDELPELWNVLRGDMSLVGPRPLLMQYIPLYTPEQARRHEVKPGLTGLAQISGRNAISWEQKFSYDVAYVDQVSLWLDLKIVARTLLGVIRRDGISAAGHSTMPFFTGARPADAPPTSRAA